MRRLFSRFRVGAILVVFAALALQLSAQTTPGSKVSKPGKHPELWGVWYMQGTVNISLLPSKDAPLTPWGQERMKINRTQALPTAICLPPGVPTIWQIPAPFEIIPLQGRILILHEQQHLIRQIYLNRKHPADMIPTWMGNSVGRWEGDTLVVDTTGFNELTWADLWGLPHSGEMHVIERIGLVSPDVLQVEMTVEDPKAYTKPWKAVRKFDRKPDWEIGENICEDNNTYLIPSTDTPKQITLP
jgi:hypothetical protein